MTIKNGALIEVNPKTGRITEAYIIASNDRDQAAKIKVLGRITKPYHWSWLKSLIFSSCLGDAGKIKKNSLFN
jgi:hypothetical protein